MKNVRITICLVVAVLLMVAGQGFGWTQFKDGETHNITTTINDDVWVDYQSPGMQTTVNLLNGGNIYRPYRLQGYNDSTINILGGSATYLYSYDNSHTTISSGSLGMDGSLSSYDNSQLTISGGTVGTCWLYDNSRAIVTDGWIAGSINASGSNQVTVTNGSMSNLLANYNSRVIIEGGKISQYLQIGGTSEGLMSGATVGGELVVSGNGKLTISGGTIGLNLTLKGNAILKLEGSNFAVDGTPLNSGSIVSILNGNSSNEPLRKLTGILTNGDIINNQFQIGDYASIVIIPEPASLLLLGLGGLLIRKR